jgi:hypothetical protein
MDRQANSATVTKLAASATAINLFAANVSRNGGCIYNDSTAILYVKLGAAATTDDWTVKLNQNDYYELPSWYGGVVTGIWASATGQGRVTEVIF